MESSLNHTPALWFQILVILLTALSAVFFHNQDYSVTGEARSLTRWRVFTIFQSIKRRRTHIFL